MELAPIVLFVYNRPWHTERVLNALELNNYADQSTLHIYCDGPKNDATKESLKVIEEVRTVIRKKKWCKNVIITERAENLGLANSVIQGVTHVIEKHKCVIVLEDDILTSKYFLEFMNDGLTMYKDEARVFGISGYQFPVIREIKETSYFLPIGSSWGYATWLNRWDKVNFDGPALLKRIDENKLQHKMNFGNYQYYKMLKDQIAGRNDSWAIRFYASMFLNNDLFLFPNSSLVENIGFDNTGTHCGLDDYYSKIKVSNKKIDLVKIQELLNENIVNFVARSFKLQNANNVKKDELNNNYRKLIRKGKKVLIKIFRTIYQGKRI